MVRPERPERNRAARSFRQHSITSSTRIRFSVHTAPPHWRKMLPPFSAKMFSVTAISPTFYSRNEDLQVRLRGRDRRLDDSCSGVREIKNDGLLRRQYGKGRRHDDEDARR